VAAKPTVHHIPICPFSQRVEILLALKGLRDGFDFSVVDITKPRSPELLAKAGGSTALPILVTELDQVIHESLVIMRYVEERFPEPAIVQRSAWQRAVENMLVSKEGPFVTAGYTLVLNRDRDKREGLVERLLASYAGLDAFLVAHAPDRDFLFESFGWAEAVFTPMFMRFWFLEYYEDFDLPDDPRYARVRRWRDACLAHPAAQQVTREEVIKLYYDYAQGAGNGGLLPGRAHSSFTFEPHWSTRPWPPKGKYGPPATDGELGIG
jgi:glutathione S-transferase